MQVYYVYSFGDDTAKTWIKDLDSVLKHDRFHPFNFDPQNKNTSWKSTARKKIKQADLVVFFVSQMYYNHRENIDYELHQAERYGKEIICVSTDNCSIPKVMDDYSGIETNHYTVKNKNELIDYITSNFHSYNVANYVFKDKDPKNMDIEEKRLLFDQYKEMFASTESLMERRQDTSSFYISINTVLVGMMAAVVALGFDLKLLCLFGIVVSIFGIVISKTWSDTLYSYDRINYSKFNVLESMEKYLPASMFYAEYKDTKNNMIKRTVPSYSAREHKIPKLFMVLYSIIGLVIIIALVMDLTGIIVI